MEIEKFKKIFASCDEIQVSDDSNLFAMKCRIKDTDTSVLFVPSPKLEGEQKLLVKKASILNNGMNDDHVEIQDMIALTLLGGTEEEREKFGKFVGKSIKDILLKKD